MQTRCLNRRGPLAAPRGRAPTQPSRTGQLCFHSVRMNSLSQVIGATCPLHSQLSPPEITWDYGSTPVVCTLNSGSAFSHPPPRSRPLSLVGQMWAWASDLNSQLALCTLNFSLLRDFFCTLRDGSMVGYQISTLNLHSALSTSVATYYISYLLLTIFGPTDTQRWQHGWAPDLNSQLALCTLNFC